MDITRLQKEARKPFGPIFFACSDSGGTNSDCAYAAMNGIDAAKQAARLI